MALQKSDIEAIVGAGNVADDDATIAAFSSDQSAVAPRRPDMVAYVQSVEQIQNIVKLANETLTPVTPYSSGLNLHGAAIAGQGGIIINMSRMNKILALDEDNWYVIIEPGVTYEQLQNHLVSKGYRIMVPFGVPPGRSVLTSYLERDPVMAAPSFEHGNFLIMDTELVLPNGALFKTGNWTSGGEPGAPAGPIRNSLFRMWTAAQGTLGIMTKMGLQIEPIPQRKVFFIPLHNVACAVKPLKQIQYREIGTECLLLNNFNLAAMLNDEWTVPADFPAAPASTERFTALRSLLPPWVLIVSVNGLPRRSAEKIAYEEEALRQVCDEANIELLETIPNISGAAQLFESEMLRPWSILKKFNFKGHVRDLTFKCPVNKVDELIEIASKTSCDGGYNCTHIGVYVLPLERARALHCEIDLHCLMSEAATVNSLWLKVSEALMNAGAYFDRPYGAWAPMVYGRAAGYSDMLRNLKKETDPNNIMNPGKLCFTN
ncbi:MAG: FAD-binding oxidoreductase [Deltaproteobacteria bacterium]|nr:FAD-binding oxidoreductase [Deltaproteobacteria bacterium]